MFLDQIPQYFVVCESMPQQCRYLKSYYLLVPHSLHTSKYGLPYKEAMHYSRATMTERAVRRRVERFFERQDLDNGVEERQDLENGVERGEEDAVPSTDSSTTPPRDTVPSPDSSTTP